MTKKPMIICTVSALAFLSACSGSASAPKGSGVVIAAQAKVPEKTADQDKDSYPESQAYFTHAEEFSIFEIIQFKIQDFGLYADRVTFITPKIW